MRASRNAPCSCRSGRLAGALAERHLATAPPSTTGTPGAGWYRDPRGVAECRYWDGKKWTEHVHGARPEAREERQVAAASGAELAAKGNLRSDIAAAKGKMRVKFGAGREIKRLPEHLWEGETVDQMTTGMYGKGNGLVVLTDRRLLFLHEGLMSKTSEDFPIEKSPRCNGPPAC
jgi:Protein of unknown function (DUF2510)